MRIKLLVALTLVGLASLGSATDALAHAEIRSTSPQAKAEVAAPDIVSFTLTEPPSEGGRVVVFDSCGSDITKQVSIDGSTIQATVGSGVPGKWTAAFKVISKLDGHPTEDRIRFTVLGERDCSGPEPTTEPTEGATEAPPTPDADPTLSGGVDGGSSFPWAPVGLGAVGLVALAVFVRRSAGS